MRREVMYFDEGGPEHTGECLKIVGELVEEGYKNVVVASTGGQTGLRFAETLRGAGVNLVVVTHSAGFKKPNELEISEKAKRQITALGASVYTGTVLAHSLATAVAGESCPTMVVIQTLRRFCQGVKVAVEIVMEACDAGLLPELEEVVAVGGTGKGADTVCLIKSAASKRFMELKVLEILAKPRK